MIARQRRAFRAAFEPFGRAGAIGSVPGACHANRHFAFEVTLDRPRSVFFAAISIDDQLIQVEYRAPRENGLVFANIVRSLGAPSSAPAAPRVAARKFAGLRLDLPVALAPPRQHCFEGRGIRLVVDRGELELTRADIAFELGAGLSDELLVSDGPAADLEWNGPRARQRGFQVQLRQADGSALVPGCGSAHVFRLARVSRRGELVLPLMAQAAPNAPPLDPLLRSILLGIEPETSV